MNRKPIIIATVVVSAVFALAGCSSSSAPAAEKPSSPTKVETPAAPAKPNLDGKWRSDAGATTYQAAVIKGKTITITWVNEDQDSESIYWVGSYAAPEKDPGGWTSTRDKAATDNALLASTDPTKDFTYANDVISYKVSALGTTKTVKLQRTKD